MVGAGVGVRFWPCCVKAARAGEIDCFFVFVKRERHDTVGGPESLLDAIAMVDVDVNVQHARVV